jgi:hypothetical protein
MKALVLITTFLVSASMSPVPDEYTKRHECVPSEEISCIMDSPFACPPGYIDGCLTNETRHHKCLIKETGPSCKLEMNLRCPDNFEDGVFQGSQTFMFASL